MCHLTFVLYSFGGDDIAQVMCDLYQGMYKPVEYGVDISL